MKYRLTSKLAQNLVVLWRSWWLKFLLLLDLLVCLMTQFGSGKRNLSPSKMHRNQVHYFEPVRKVSNKIWATKHSKRPIIAKHSLSTKKVLYAIFFSGEGVAIKVPVKKGKSITRKYYRDVVLKKLKKNFIRNDALPLVLNMSVFYMTMPQLIPPQ